MKSREGRIFILISSLALTIGSVFAASTSISIPNIEFGSGSAQRSDCLTDGVVDYVTSMSGQLTELTISGIGNECAGKWVRISLFTSSDGSGLPVEQVVWQIPAASSPPVASYTVRANGNTTGVVSGVVWPASEAGVDGLRSGVAAVSVSTINSFLLDSSDSALSDEY
jgi:hypothetical protein